MKIIKKFKKYSKRINILIEENKVGLNLVDKILIVKGPLGEIRSVLKNQYIGDSIFVKKEHLEYLENTVKKLIHSVYIGWQIEIDLNGVGYKAFTLDNNKLALDLGYSNLIIYKNTPLLSLKNYKNKIILFSTNLEYLKDVAFKLRCYAKPDPYKGKGILYSNEILKLKKKNNKCIMSMYIDLTKPKLKSKKLIYALKSIYGINLTLAKNICKILGYDINMKINECRDQDLAKISSIINLYLKFLFSDELRKNIYDNIQKMKIIKSYKGIRHSYSLPVNGQRTRTNSRTRRWR